MSHITSIDIEINNIEALDAAVREMGAVLVRNKSTYKWYGHSTGPIPQGFTTEMLGKCEHAINLPSTNYEIGVVRNPAKPSTYTLLYDFWGQANVWRPRRDLSCQEKRLHGHTQTSRRNHQASNRSMSYPDISEINEESDLRLAILSDGFRSTPSLFNQKSKCQTPIPSSDSLQKTKTASSE